MYGAGWIVLADGTQTGTQTRNRRDHRAAPPLERDRVEVVEGTRPPTTTPTTTTAPRPTKPRPEDGRLEQQVPVRVVDQAGVASARLCAVDPARCT